MSPTSNVTAYSRTSSLLQKPVSTCRRFYGFGKALKPLLFDIRSGSLTERRLL
ncbi:hypothetical protein PspP5CL_22640, partial [Pseudomonas syringae]|nr:hypothetical protein [Pseudomonas syringae]